MLIFICAYTHLRNYRKCKLDEIYIDDVGMCSHCVNVDTYDPLDKIKQKASLEIDE